MTVLLYNYCELEERAATHLKAWKVWHLILYTLAALFGVANYIILHHASQLVDNKCVLFPRILEFKVISLKDTSHEYVNYTLDEYKPINTEKYLPEDEKNETIAQETVPDNKMTEKSVSKREISGNDTTMEVANETVITGNHTHQKVLDTTRTLFATEGDCEFAEYMPVVSTVCALVWITLFTMCPGGGRPRSGLHRPWRILTPALVFAVVLVGLTGHSFRRTNSGLQAFCSAFVELNVTHDARCSSVEPLLENSASTAWGFGARATAARAASAAVWAAWVCIAALLLARCLAAPDFIVKRTGVYLKDPHGKLTPHLRKSRRHRRSPASPVSKRDNASLASEPTFTTELATASVEPGLESVPTSLMATPVRKDRGGHAETDLIEMAYSPQERRL